MEASKKETCLLFLISTYTECMCRVCSLCICEVEVEMKCDDYTFFFRYMVVLVFQSTSHSLLCVHTVQICLKTERKGKLCMVMEGIENINMLLIFSWMRTRLPEVGVSKNQRLCMLVIFRLRWVTIYSTTPLVSMCAENFFFFFQTLSMLLFLSFYLLLYFFIPTFHSIAFLSQQRPISS